MTDEQPIPAKTKRKPGPPKGVKRGPRLKRLLSEEPTPRKSHKSELEEIASIISKLNAMEEPTMKRTLNYIFSRYEKYIGYSHKDL